MSKYGCYYSTITLSFIRCGRVEIVFFVAAIMIVKYLLKEYLFLINNSCQILFYKMLHYFGLKRISPLSRVIREDVLI